MNFTWSHYDGPRDVSLVLDSASTPVSVQPGTVQTLEAVQVHVGMRGENSGVGSMTGGAGIVIIGTEIRLSIGTLPQT